MTSRFFSGTNLVLKRTFPQTRKENPLCQGLIRIDIYMYIYIRVYSTYIINAYELFVTF